MKIFYERNQEKKVTRGNLPHWTQYGKMHFVTFRLADSLPYEQIKLIKKRREEWIAGHKQPYTNMEWREYNRLFAERIEKWIDAGYGECLLADDQYANIVAQAVRYFAQDRYYLDHWVIMPNHVHILVIPVKPYTLKEILHSWKSFTSKEINKLRRFSGEVWLHESFDHIVRNAAQLNKFRSYIIDNWENTNQTAMISKQNIELTTQLNACAME